MYARALAGAALSYAVLHHLGLLPDGLGEAPEGTRWADWLDLLVPYLVLGPAALALAAARPDARTWALFGLGSIAYAGGHGMHLAANSIGNVDPGDTAHLWDEVVSHHVWFAGVALVVAALARTMDSRPPPHWSGHLLALAVGLTWASNAVGGGTVLFSLLLASAATAWGVVRHDGLGVVMAVAGVPAVVVLVTVLLS